MARKKAPEGLKEDFLSRLPQQKQHIIAVAILVILPIILFNATVLGGQQFLGHDTVQWRAGAESAIQYRQNTGQEALWVTNMFSGMPAYVVSVQKAVTNLDSILFDITHAIFPATRYWVLLIGLYVFFWLQGMRPLTSALGSLLIGFTTYIPIIIGAGHNTKFTTFAFIPWMFVGYWLLTRTKKHRIFSLFAFAFALTLQFRAGHPQVTYYFFYLLAFWWIFDTVNAWRNNEIKDWSMTTGLLALGGVLAIVSNLQPYWSMIEYTPFSTRGGSAVAGGSGLNLQYAMSWSQGWSELLTLIIPGLFGGASAEGTYWGPKSFTSGPHYLGAITFLLALCGLIIYKERRKYLFAGVGLLTILFSVGYHFETLNAFMFKHVPYFNKFRTPEMWLIVTVFCFGVLAVYGLHELIERGRKVRDEGLKPLYAPLGIALGLGVLFAFASGSLLSFQKPGEFQQYAQQVARQNNVSPSDPRVEQRVRQFIDTQLVPKRKAKAESDAQRYLLIVLIASILVVLLYQRKVSVGYFLLGLIILGSYDMLTVGHRYLNEDALVPEDVEASQYIERQKRPLDSFIQEHIDSEDGVPYRVLPLADNPFNNAVPAYFYPSLGGYTGAKLSIYQDLIDEALFTGPQGINTGVLDMLNTKYIVAKRPLPLPGFKLVYDKQDGKVYENTHVLPKAFFADSVITQPKPHQALEMIKPASDIDLDHTAVVEAENLPATQPDSNATVQVTHYGARDITLQTQRNNEGFLVLSEIYYPAGWRAYIDGQPTKIYKTNYVLRGVEVPAGKHEIRFAFNPASYVWGARIAWLGSILVWLMGLGAIYRWYSDRRVTETPEEKES